MTRNKPRSLVGIVTALFLGLVAGPLSATWSIVIVNSETGEVAIGSATCLSGFDLKEGAGVIVVGKGAGQAQAFIDFIDNRKRIWNNLHAGNTATETLAALEAQDPQLHVHQYGIATLHPDVATYTGSQTTPWTGGLTGSHGPLHYAIQGNILTCETVITAAEEALVTTRGDTAQRLMAAMWAARYYGGDGRCSCQGPPTSCGCMEPSEFNKSARVGYMVVARIGDTDGVCTAPAGCANGDYYLDLNVFNQPAPDPVVQLQPLLDEFRKEWRGHADHIRSKKVVRGGPLPADGTSAAKLELALVDINQNPLGSGGATITVTHHEDSASLATIGAVTDNGDGTYSVPLTAGIEAGTDVLQVVVEDGMGPVTLYPHPTLEHLVPALTTAGGVDAGPHSSLPLFLLEGPDELAGQPFALIASVAGAPSLPLAFGLLDEQSRSAVDMTGWGPLPADATVGFRWAALNGSGFVSNPIELSFE